MNAGMRSAELASFLAARLLYIAVVAVALPRSKLDKFNRVAPLISTDHCDTKDPLSCLGDWNIANGTCVETEFGSRCECPAGWMGKKCERPCQDIYRSCPKWRDEGRCDFILPFFADNCAHSCAICEFVNSTHLLPNPLPVVLEPLAWLVGRWTTTTFKGYRFPEPFGEGSGNNSHGYKEVLDIQLTEVPMFDRPVLNVSIIATSVSSHPIEEHRELGFIAIQPLKEETGFTSNLPPAFKRPPGTSLNKDLVAIQLTSNTGLVTIEEGDITPSAFQTLSGVTGRPQWLDNPEFNIVVTQMRELHLTPDEEESDLISAMEAAEKKGPKWSRENYVKTVHRRFRYLARDDVLEERLTIIIQPETLNFAHDSATNSTTANTNATTTATVEDQLPNVKKVLKKFRRVQNYLHV